MIVAAVRPAGWFAAPAEAGGRQRTHAAAAAFTLLEILLALALLALLAGATISISANVVGNNSASAEDQFWKALNEARKEALTSQQDVLLSFDDKAETFVVQNGPETKTFAVTASNGKGVKDNLTVGFLPAQATSSLILVGGEAMETQTLPAVTLYADGTSTPFRVQFRRGGAAHVIAIDPWTCTEVLEEKK